MSSFILFLTKSARILLLCIGLLCLMQGIARAQPELPQLSPRLEGTIKSEYLGPGTETILYFVNRSTKPVNLYWLDYNGERVFKAQMQPGQGWGESTVFTHPFLITDANGVGLYIVAAYSQPLWLTTVIEQPKYRVIDLGTLGGGFSIATGINSSGQVVGNALIPEHAFLYSGGIMRDLGTLGGSVSYATGINPSGQVVGYATTPGNGFTRAFLYSGGVMTDLGSLGGGTSIAHGINASGQVVGYSYRQNSVTQHAFLYSGGGMHDLGTLGGLLSEAHGINDSGQVVGYAYTSGDTARHAFLYSGGVMRDLGTLGGRSSEAYGINASGQVVGVSSVPFLGNHAFLYSGGVMTDLGSLGGDTSIAYGINASGQVVGYSYMHNYFAYPGNGAQHAFLYSGGVMLEINGLLDVSGVGYTVANATAIADNGMIAAHGTTPSGEYHALLLTPILGPSDVTNSIMVTRGGFRRNATTKRYTQTLTLKNIGASNLNGPISLVLDNLSNNATLYNKNGLTSATTPAGRPYINATNGALAPGANGSVTLDFTNPTNQAITYSTRVLAEPGTR